MVSPLCISHWGKRHFKHIIIQWSNIYPFSITQLAVFMAVLLVLLLNNQILVNLHKHPGQMIISKSFHISKRRQTVYSRVRRRFSNVMLISSWHGIVCRMSLRWSQELYVKKEEGRRGGGEGGKRRNISSSWE